MWRNALMIHLNCVNELSIFFTFAMGIQSTALAQNMSLPTGWRTPIGKELNADWRNHDHGKYSVVEGDSNSDDVVDKTMLLISLKDHSLGPNGSTDTIYQSKISFFKMIITILTKTECGHFTSRYSIVILPALYRDVKDKNVCLCWSHAEGQPGLSWARRFDSATDAGH
jgi:hypothetical protein